MYQQCFGSLITNTGYCASGVACDLYNKLTKRGKWVFNEYGEYYSFLSIKIDGYSVSDSAPEEVSVFFNLDLSEIEEDNDVSHITFSDIANNLEGVSME